MDKIIYPVCALCRDYEWFGFVEGIKVGIRLEKNYTNNRTTHRVIPGALLLFIGEISS